MNRLAISLYAFLLICFSAAWGYAMPDIPHGKVSIFGQEVDLDDPLIQRRVEREFLKGLDHPSLYWLLAQEAGAHFKIFEEKLSQEGLSPDFKFLVAVESAFRANARSPVGAGGFWQFMRRTGSEMKLRINAKECIDERYDLDKATSAAVRYLKQLYEDPAFKKDWLLVLAAYNAGPGEIKARINKQKEDNYWRLYLSEENARFVPKIIATMIILNDSQRYLKISEEDLLPPLMIEKREESFKVATSVWDVAKTIGISPHEFAYVYNPHLMVCDKLLPGKTYTLYFPLPLK